MIEMLILAAGKSRRFGEDKRFVTMPKGGPLLPALIRRAGKAGLGVSVILAAEDREVAATLQARCLYSPRAAGGMGYSLADGIAQLSRQVESVLIMPADLPLIRISSIRAVAAAATADTIVVPHYRGQRGHPVAIGRLFWAELAGLTGDVGAKLIISRHRASIVDLDLDDPGICADGDTPEQMHALFARMSPPE